MRTRWTRAVMTSLAVPDLIVGVRAITAPRSWFDDVPGWAPRLGGLGRQVGDS